MANGALLILGCDTETDPLNTVTLTDGDSGIDSGNPAVDSSEPETTTSALSTFDTTPVQEFSIPNLRTDGAARFGDEIVVWGQYAVEDRSEGESPFELRVYLLNPTTDGQRELEFPLPEPKERSYGSPIRLANGDLAMTYQSDAAFGTQDGTHHGFVVIDPNTGLLIDDVGLPIGSNPSGLVEHDGQIYVLLSNRNREDHDFEIAAFDSESHALIQTHHFDTVAKGASDMTLTEQDGKIQIVVSTTSSHQETPYTESGGEGVNESYAEGYLVVINPVTWNVEDQIMTSHGLGISVSSVGGTLFVSGSETATQNAFAQYSPANGYLEMSLQALRGDTIAETGVGGIFPSSLTADARGYIYTSYHDPLTLDDGRVINFANGMVADLETGEMLVYPSELAVMVTPFVLVGEGNEQFACVGTVDMDTNSFDDSQAFDTDFACYDVSH